MVDNDAVSITILGTEKDEIWGYTVKLYLENKTDKEVMFTTEEDSINGYMVDPFFSVSLAPGACMYSGISWSDSTLEESGIDKVESIEMVMRAYDIEDWSADDLVNERVTYKPAE